MQVAHRIAKNTGILYLQMAITMVMSLYITRLVLLALGNEDFGIFNLIAGAVGLLTFLNGAMTASSQRFMSYACGEGNIEKLKNVFNTSIVLHLCIGIGIVLLLEILGYFLFDYILKIPADRIDIARIVYQFLIVNTFFAVISVPYDAVINANENMLFVAILRIIETVLLLASALYITYQKSDKLFVYGLFMTLVSIFLFFVRQIYCHFKYVEVVINIRKYRDETVFKEMYAHAGWSLLGSSSSILTMQGITIILNNFFGVLVNAAQGVSNQISGQLMAFSNTMLKSLNPVIVKSEGASNRKQMLMASITGNKLSFFLLSFFAIPMLVEMPFVLTVWLKNVPNYAVVFCRLTILRLMISQLSVTFPTAIGATNKIKQSQLVESCIYIFLLPVSYFMFQMGFSPEYIYINLIVMVGFLFISRIYFTHKLCGLLVKNYFQDVVFRCVFVASVTMGIALIPMFLINEGFIRLIIVILSSLIVFFIMIVSVGLNIAEKNIIYSVYKNLLFKILKK
jgi:Na+-driven multidrug efflux pump